MESFTIARVSFYVRNYRGDPNSVKTHVLNVIELVDDALVSSTAVFSISGVTCRARAIRGLESVSNKLVKLSVSRIIGRQLEEYT